MKNFSIPIVVFLLFLLSCSKNTLEDENPIKPITEEQKLLVSGNNDFAFNLFKRVNVVNKEKNIFISPFSVSIALSMTLNGANGETFEAMRSTLGLQNLSLESINFSYKELIPLLTNLDENVKMLVANSVWCRYGVAFEQNFLNVLRNYYDAKSDVLDFSSPEAVRKINQWVEDKTNGTIKEIIKEIPKEAVMYILNAIYFKGAWKYKFDKSKTREGDFIVSDNNYVKAMFMLQAGNYDCFFNEEFSALRLPYGKGNFAFVVLLPNYQNDIDNFIASFDRTKWENCINNLKETEEVTVYLPKFKTEFDVKLKEILAAMGMSIAFSEFADFSNLCKTLACQITNVIHKGYVEVSEEGTEASAVTAVEIGYTSSRPAFYLNRPFVYVIYERNTGAILFMGKLANPTAN
jgi:serpin B